MSEKVCIQCKTTVTEHEYETSHYGEWVYSTFYHCANCNDFVDVETLPKDIDSVAEPFPFEPTKQELED